MQPVYKVYKHGANSSKETRRVFSLPPIKDLKRKSSFKEYKENNKEKKLSNLYKFDKKLLKEIKKFQNDSNVQAKRKTFNLNDYQSKLFNFASKTMEKDNLENLKAEFRKMDVFLNSSFQGQSPKTKWQRLADNLGERIPDFLAYKLNHFGRKNSAF